jgi:AraC-like DNA-binding protein
MITPKDRAEPENGPGLLVRVQEWERVARAADFRPTRMAALCSISERQLERVFKRHLNCTPSQWLRELQCRLAKELVAQGYTSKAAAAELKFATDAHFCREFKKVFGTSPQTFAPNRLGYLSLAAVLDRPGREVRRTGELGMAEVRRSQGGSSDRRLYPR